MISKMWEGIDVSLTEQTKESKKSNKSIDNHDLLVTTSIKFIIFIV